MDKEKLMTEEEWLAKYNAGQKKAKRKNVRKWVRNGVALGLVAVLSVAGTLAYLQKKTTDKVNTFTGSAGLKLMLTESAWDYDNDNDPNTDGSVAGCTYSQEPLARTSPYTPGQDYAKNPQVINWETTTWANIVKNTTTHFVTNTGGTSNDLATTDALGSYDYSEYVAIKIELTGHDGDDPDAAITYSALKNVIDDIIFKKANWHLIAYKNSGDATWTQTINGDAIGADGKFTNAMDSATSFVFAYGGTYGTYAALEPGKATEPLFEKITVKQQTALKKLTGATLGSTDKYPSFKMNISAAAVDTNTSDFADASSGDITTALFDLLSVTL